MNNPMINLTSTSIIIADVGLVIVVGSIVHEQLTVLGYSLGNDGLIRLRPLDDVILCFEQTSTIDESEREKEEIVFEEDRILILLLIH